MRRVALVECPRDASQGLAVPLATETKAAYLRAVTRIGWPTARAIKTRNGRSA